MITTGVSAVSGLGFGLAGLASSVAAVGYTRVTRRLGYVRTAAAASGLMALAVLLIGISPWTSVVVIAIGFSGPFTGVVIPAAASMIGLETPHDAESPGFGFHRRPAAVGLILRPLNRRAA